MAEGNADIPLDQFEDFVLENIQTPQNDVSGSNLDAQNQRRRTGVMTRGRGNWSSENRETPTPNARPGHAEIDRIRHEMSREPDEQPEHINVRRNLMQQMAQGPQMGSQPQGQNQEGEFSSPTQHRLQRPDSFPPLEQLIWNLLEDGRRRKQLLLNVCDRALGKAPNANINNASNDQPSTNYQVMPDITKNFEDFNEEIGTSKAKD